MAIDCTHCASGVPIPADDVELARTANYPHLIVRIYCAVYQRECIDVRIGAPAVGIKAGGRSYVQYPEPLNPNGTLSLACREMLIIGFQAAVRRFRFRMCLVWAPGTSTYVEAESIINATGHPSGGWNMPSPIQFDSGRLPVTPGLL